MDARAPFETEPSPYGGASVALASMHAKERALSPPFQRKLGWSLVVPDGLDTDQLGTFSGEIERGANALETATRKARLGMVLSGLPRGLASEGSFGPHPNVPVIAGGQEVLVFIDEERGIEISEGLITHRTNFDDIAVAPGDALDLFLERVCFPSHGLIVRPDAPEGEPRLAPLAKGVRDFALLRRHLSEAVRRSPVGRARLETDMRAHVNPTRMRILRRLAVRLADRLASACPACQAPGFGRTGVKAGLPCRACGTATDVPHADLWSCASCGRCEERLRPVAALSADPGRCPECNP